jgi:hypothetical protein
VGPDLRCISGRVGLERLVHTEGWDVGGLDGDCLGWGCWFGGVEGRWELRNFVSPALSNRENMCMVSSTEKVV